MDPLRILRTLDERDVAYVLIGGLAATAHGVTIATYDVDLCFEATEANVERMIAALADLEAEVFPIRSRPIPMSPELLLRHGIVNLKTRAGRLDLLAEVPGLGTYADLEPSTELLDLGGRPVKVLSIAQLIRSKQATGQIKDRHHLDQLRALERLRAGRADRA